MNVGFYGGVVLPEGSHRVIFALDYAFHNSLIASRNPAIGEDRRPVETEK